MLTWHIWRCRLVEKTVCYVRQILQKRGCNLWKLKLILWGKASYNSSKNGLWARWAKKGRKRKVVSRKKRRGGHHHMNFNYDHESNHATHGAKRRYANPRRVRKSPSRDVISTMERSWSRCSEKQFRFMESQSRFISFTVNNKDRCIKSYSG